MSVRTITLSALAVTALAITALTGCAEDEVALGGGSASEPAQGGQIEDAAAGAESPLAQATIDDLPGMPITECPQAAGYEHSVNGSRSFWHLVYTCTDRAAFDATGAAFVAGGYESTPLVISEGANVSERNHLLADANGGSTEVQLNLVGSGDDLEFEIYITIELP